MTEPTAVAAARARGAPMTVRERMRKPIATTCENRDGKSIKVCTSLIPSNLQSRPATVDSKSPHSPRGLLFV